MLRRFELKRAKLNADPDLCLAYLDLGDDNMAVAVVHLARTRRWLERIVAGCPTAKAFTGPPPTIVALTCPIMVLTSYGLQAMMAYGLGDPDPRGLRARDS